jgi:amino-acid N-acetyltransferase
MRPRVALTFVPATPADLDLIRTLLSASGLPIDDVDQHVAEFILARCQGETVGTAALEQTGQTALLRSVCVAPGHRGSGVGTRLLAAIEAKAASRGVRELYLLTTGAAAFFEHHGFSTSARADVPPGIRSTAQFRTLCPSTASCMCKALASRSNQQTGSP